MKTLIFYYSWKGKTKSAALALQSLTGGELRRIEEVKIKRGFLYNLINTVRAIFDIRNDLRPYNPDLLGYDRIFIGTPVWAGSPVPAVNAFIDEAEIKNKKIVIFCTHIFSNPSGALKKLSAGIKKSGGKVSGMFAVRTTKKNMAGITDKVKAAAKKFI